MSLHSLEELEDRLEHELQSFGRTDDRQLAARIRDEGRRLVFLLSGLVRASRLYAAENDALAAPSQELAEVLSGLLDRLGVVHVVLVADQAYVNDVRLRVRPSEQQVIEQLSAEWARHELGGVSFHGHLDARGLRRLARAVATAAGEVSPAEALRARLADLRGVELSGRWHFEGADGDETVPEPGPGETLARAAAEAHDNLLRLDAGWMPHPVRLRRAVIGLLRELGSRPERAALAPFTGATSGSERHLVSVCQLSLLLGRAVGLSDAVLADLGVTALLHDVGYLTERDPSRHALAGARLLLRQRGPSPARIPRILAVLEHARDFRPAGDEAGPASLFARILHVAEHYDLMVSAGPVQSRLAPSTALARLWAGRGRFYDPILVALLARELGFRPPGTVLQLGDGRWGIVVRRGAGRERWAHPVVRIVRQADGSVGDGAEVDLSQRRDLLGSSHVVEPALVTVSVAAACQVVLTHAA